MREFLAENGWIIILFMAVFFVLSFKTIKFDINKQVKLDHDVVYIVPAGPHRQWPCSSEINPDCAIFVE